MQRIWIYQANRILTSQEAVWLEKALKGLVAQWNSHGTDLAANAELRYNLFIILMVDDELTPASGCSIDSSVHFLKKVEEHLGITLFDRMNIAFRNAEGQISTVTRAEFEQLLSSGQVNHNTPVFNNLIQDYRQLESAWEVPMHASWHVKVFGSGSYTA